MNSRCQSVQGASRIRQAPRRVPRAAARVCAFCCSLGLVCASEAFAQVVQLPSYSFYSNTSSAWVPDRGIAHLGGVNQSSSGSSQFGPPFLPPSRSFGSQTSASSSIVSVQIQDLNEMDEAVLARARARSGARFSDLRAPNDAGEEQLPPRAPGHLASVEELRAREAASKAAIAAETEQLAARARQAIAAGKTGAAKIYLQMAIKRADEPLKSQLLAELHGLAPPVIAKRSR